MSARSNQPCRVSFAPVKLPLLVAEELRVDQLARNRAAIDAHERPAVPLAAIVNRAGDQFLAGARFAQNQHGHFGAADQIDALHDVRQAGLFADDRFARRRCGRAGAAAIAARPRPLRAARPARAAGRRCRARRPSALAARLKQRDMLRAEIASSCAATPAACRANRVRRRAARAANRRLRSASAAAVREWLRPCRRLRLCASGLRCRIQRSSRRQSASGRLDFVGRSFAEFAGQRGHDPHAAMLGVEPANRRATASGMCSRKQRRPSTRSTRRYPDAAKRFARAPAEVGVVRRHESADSVIYAG